MKKAVLLALTVFALVCCSALNVFAYADYSFDNINFTIPDYMFLDYSSENENVPSASYRWHDADRSMELAFNYTDDELALTLPLMTLTEVENFYSDVLCTYPEYFTCVGSGEHVTDDNNFAVTVYGTVAMDGYDLLCESYLYSCGENVYVFEFFYEDDSQHYFVEDIIDSVYLFDIASSLDYEYDNDFEDFLEIFGYVIMLILIVAFKFLKSKGKKEKNSNNKTAESKPDFKPIIKKDKSAERVNLMTKFKKFEINGKDVTVFNERFTVGKDDSNFAAKELERERKEREKMFY